MFSPDLDSLGLATYYYMFPASFQHFIIETFHEAGAAPSSIHHPGATSTAARGDESCSQMAFLISISQMSRLLLVQKDKQKLLVKYEDILGACRLAGLQNDKQLQHKARRRCDDDIP